MEEKRELHKKILTPKHLSFKAVCLSVFVGILFAGLFSGAVYVLADPPSSAYNPGSTLNPSCAPGSTNCTVTAPVPYTGATTGLNLGSQDFTTTGATTIGNLSVNGNTTLGDASGDTVMANAATWTFANDTNVTLSGGVNGLSFDTDTFSIDATNDRIGVGTEAPGQKIHAHATSDEASSPSIFVSGDLPTHTPAFWTINDYDGTPNYGGMGLSGTTLRLTSNLTGSFGDSEGISVIQTSGNIGIGTQTPDRVGYGAGHRVMTIETSTASRVAVLEFVGKDRPLNTDVGGLDFINNNAGSFDRLAGITGRIDTVDLTSGKLVFATTKLGTLGYRMALDEDGNLGVGHTSPSAQLHIVQAVNTSGSPTALLIAGGSHTTLTASTEATDINFNLARTIQFATGALTTQRAFLVQAPTYGFVGASTLTTATTMEISGAPIAGTNATITNAYGLRINAGQATAVPLVVKGAASQSANLTEWQNSSAGILSFIDSSGILNLGLAGTQTGTLKLNGTTSGTVTINPAAAAGTWTFTLPTTGGTNTYALTTNGSGTSTWAQIDLTAAVTGTLPVTNGGTGQTSYTDGQLLIGNTTGNTLTKATLTGTTNQVVVTNGTGSITLSTPQDIATSSSPTFVTMTLTGNLSVEGNSTIGNASGDTVTVNAATWTFANDTNFVLSGGVNGLSFDTDTLSIDGGNNRVGIGTASPSHRLAVGDDLGAVTLAEAITLGDADNNAKFIMGDGTNYAWLEYGREPARLTFNQIVDATTYADTFVIRSGTIGIGQNVPSATLDIVNTATAGGLTTLELNPGAHTAMTAEKNDFIINAHTNTITGGYATQRFSLFSTPTITAASALTVTNADTVNIAGIPTAAGSAVISGASALRIPVAPQASANVGLVSLGSGAWDGSTAGYFGTGGSSDSDGTILAINAASGYAGDLANFQVAGASMFKIDASGNVTATGAITETGNKTITGNLEVNGNTTLGDASGDTMTFNAATLSVPNASSWTFSGDTNFILTGGVNALSFDTDTFSIDEDNNRVGIGMTNPGYMLDVFGGAIHVGDTSAGNASVWIGDTQDKPLSQSLYLLYDSTSATVSEIKTYLDASQLSITAGTTDGLQSKIILYGGTHASVPDAMVFQINNVEQMRIGLNTLTFANDTNFVLSGGVNGLSFDTTTLSIDALNDRVGIGTASPETTLHVQAASPIIRIQDSDSTQGNAQSGYMAFYDSAGTLTSYVGDASGSDTKLYMSNGYGSLQFQAGTAGSFDNRMIIDSGGNVGIGTLTPEAGLDIITANDVISLKLADIATDATNKEARIGVGHYTNAEEPTALIVSGVTSTLGLVKMGGGVNNMNAATELQFFTAANNTTLTGTQRMTITSGGLVGIGVTPTQLLHVATTTTSVTGSSLIDMTRMIHTINPSGASTDFYTGTYVQTLTDAANAQNITGGGAGLYGARYDVDHYGSGSINSVVGFLSQVTNRNTGTISNLVAVDASVRAVTAAGTATTAYGVRINAPTISGSSIIAENRGISIANMGISGTTTSYGLILSAQSGSTTNYAIWSGGGESVLQTGASTTIGLKVRGAASQTANLQEWQNSSATVLTNIDASGRLFLPAGATGAGNLALSTTGDTDTGLYFSAADEMILQTGGSDRITVDASGNVGIGTAPTYRLDVLTSGTGVIARFNSDNSTGCTLADGGTISCSSDVRLKKNINDINYGLAELMALRPVVFNWNSDADGATKSLGFIAQEVETVIPKLVITDPQTGFKQLNTVGLVPVLAKAIQEQQQQIQQLLQQAGISSALTNSSMGQISGVDTSLSDKITNILANFGISIKDGVTNITQLFAQKATISTATITKLQMIDSDTGEIYCTWIASGQWQKVKGECANLNTQSSSATSTPETSETMFTIEPIDEPVTSDTSTSTVDSPVDQPTISTPTTDDQTPASTSTPDTSETPTVEPTTSNDTSTSTVDSSTDQSTISTQTTDDQTSVFTSTPDTSETPTVEPTTSNDTSTSTVDSSADQSTISTPTTDDQTPVSSP